MGYNFDIQVAHSVTDVSPQAWNFLSQGRPFATYRWYQYGEAVLTNETPLYIILSHDSQPVARATFWLTRDEPLPLPDNLARSFMEAAFNRWPLLLCRTPMASHSGLILPQEEGLRAAALDSICAIAHDFASRHGVSFVLFDYLADGDIRLPGYAGTDMLDAGTYLPIRWSSFEEYVAQMSRSARKDYHRHCNRADDLNITVNIRADAPDLDQAVRLIQNVERQHNTRPNPRTRRALEKAGIAGATWLTADIDGHMVGCGMLLGDGDHRALAFLGLDYDVKYVYFQMLYAAVRCAIETGARVLHGGSGAYEIKERLGFQPERNNYVAFRAHNRILGQVVQHLIAS